MCNLIPYRLSASLASKSPFSSGEIEAQSCQSAWPRPQECGNPKEDWKAPSRGAKEPTTGVRTDDGDHRRILLFVLATRLPVFLMGVLPEAGQVVRECGLWIPTI